MRLKHGRAALTFVIVTAVLDMVALGVTIPVLPKLIESFVHGDTALAARMLGLFGTVWALMQFVCSPILGVLSDRFGRRPVILISNFGLGIDYIFMVLAPSLPWLLVGRIISGITSASIPAAGGYIADVTPPEKRAAGFGMLGMAFGIGFILGPALGGLCGQINPRLPFAVAAAISFLNAAYGFFILPESLTVENRVPFSWKRANPIGSLNLIRAHRPLIRFAFVHLFNSIAHAVLPSVFVIYASYRYGWDARDVGLTLALVGITNGLVQGFLVGRAVKKFGERRVLWAGLTFGLLGFVVCGFASTGKLCLLSVPILALWGLGGAALQSLLSQQVASNEQGQLQGANGCIQGIAEMIGPGLFTLTFSHFISGNGPHLPGAPFLLAAILMLATIFISLLPT